MNGDNGDKTVYLNGKELCKIKKSQEFIISEMKIFHTKHEERSENIKKDVDRIYKIIVAILILMATIAFGR